MPPDRRPAGRAAAAALAKDVRELGRDDDVLRPDDVDAMGERRAGEVGVEERHHAAGADDAEPDRDDIPAGWASAGRRRRPSSTPFAIAQRA